jgi:transcriptional regulator with XRE-family HTH domain
MATLSAQLSSRLLKFLRKHPDITQRSVAKYLDLSPSFLSEVISGKKNLNSLSAMKLSQILEQKPAAKADPTIKRFEFKGKPLSSHIEHFSGTDGSWVPGLVGVDPAASSSIVDPAHDPADCLASTLTCLASLQGIYRKAISSIDSFIAKAQVNRTGTTPPTLQHFTC